MRRQEFIRCRRLFGVLLLAFIQSTGSLVATDWTVSVSYGTGYSPSQLTIKPGDTVTFRTSGESHTVTGSGSDPFCGDTLLYNGNPTCVRTFNTVGSFPYYCLFHGNMKGQIDVETVAVNAAPTIQIYVPTNFTAVSTIPTIPTVSAAPTNVFQAFATDSDGTVTKVEFFYGKNVLSITNSIGVTTNRTNNIFTLVNSNSFPFASNLVMVAKATDNLGAEGFSPPVNFNAGLLLTLPVYSANGTFQFHLSASNGSVIVLQGSVTLTSWVGILTNTITNGLNYIDSTASNNLYRFYRVFQQP